MFMWTDVQQILIEFIWMWLWFQTWLLGKNYWIFLHSKWWDILYQYMYLSDSYLYVDHGHFPKIWIFFSDTACCQLCELVRDESMCLCAQTRIQPHRHQSNTLFNRRSHLHAEQQWAQWWKCGLCHPQSLTPAVTIQCNIQMMYHRTVYFKPNITSKNLIKSFKQSICNISKAFRYIVIFFINYFMNK